MMMMMMIIIIIIIIVNRNRTHFAEDTNIALNINSNYVFPMKLLCDGP
jgi:hypothetical protein